MSGSQFNFEMVLRSDVTSAKASLNEVKTGLQGVSAEAGKASRATAAEAAELERLAGAAGKAAQSQQDLATAERRAIEQRQRAQIGPVNVLANPQATSTAAIWRAGETSADRLRQAVSGLNVELGDQARDMVAASQATQAWQASLNEVRASFNPVFAAQLRYEQQLKRIADAEELGAISALEAADARKRAASMSRSNAGGISSGLAATAPGYFAAQGNDVMMMALLGQNPATLALQQGPQISAMLNQMGGGVQSLKALGAGVMSIVNPLSLATIGIIGLGAAGVQWLGSLSEETRTLDETLADLDSAVDAVAKANERARMSASGLAAEFGSVSSIARQLLADMSELSRRSAARDVSAVLQALPRGAGLALQNPEGEVDDLRRNFGLSTWKQESWDLAHGVRDAYLDVSRSDGLSLDEQIARVQRLKDAYTAAAEAADGITKTEDSDLAKIQAALDQLLTLKGQDENAAGTAEAGKLTRELERQVELQRVATQFGKESREYRAEEYRQARQSTLQKIDDLGLDRESAEARSLLGALSRAFFANEQGANEERRQAQADWLTGKDDEIAAINREISLIGATREARIMATAAAEADIEIRERKLSLAEAEEAREKHIAKAVAEVALERKRALAELQNGLRMDQLDIALTGARDPISRANLEAQREYVRQIDAGADADVAAGEAARVRAKSVGDALAQTRNQTASLLDEVAVRQQVAAQVAAGIVPAAEANRVIQEELQLRPLIAAAARAEGEEKRRLTEVITGLRMAQEAMAAENRRAAANDYLRAGAERIAGLRLELLLAGQTEATRARVLALVKAEQDIRRLGLTGAAADNVRRNAEVEIELARSIEAQADAWKQVQSAGEAAIDGVLDKLRGGDVKGALASMVDEIGGMFFDLSVRNPLKNAILGTNLGTLDSIGGIGGIWGRLTGANQIDERAAVAMGAAPVQAMTIAATQVTINAGGLDLAGLSGSPANLTGAPFSGGGLTGSGDVQAQVWSFFAAKGLAPHQIAGIMGNVSGESAFNPLAVGDNGNAFGLFQHNDRRHKLFDFIGGKQNLGDVQGQLEFVWQELMTSESRAMRQLMSAGNVREATAAFAGFERPRGFSWANPEGAHNFDGRLAGAEAALTKFGTAAQTATSDLGVLGSGMGDFGSALTNILSGKSGGGDWASLLISLGGKAFGIPGFRGGGSTGDGDPSEVAGVVHKGEFVFNASTTRRIGVRNLEALQRGTMPGYRSGGYVSGGYAPAIMPPTAANGSGGSNVVIHNYSGQPARSEETLDASGQRQTSIIIGEQVGAAIAQPGNPAQKSIARTFGARRQGVAR